MNPSTYLIKFFDLLLGCIILGFGVYLEVLADVVMLPGESFVRAIVVTWNRNFGNIKVIFDASMTASAVILSILCSSKLDGVREGTLIAALLVGFIAKFFGNTLSFLKPILYGEIEEDEVSLD